MSQKCPDAKDFFNGLETVRMIVEIPTGIYSVISEAYEAAIMENLFDLTMAQYAGGFTVKGLSALMEEFNKLEMESLLKDIRF